MKNNNRSLIELFKKLKIAPNSYFLYIEALTHSSYHNDNHLDYDYERLEFLGDQVISFVVCEYLYNKNPKLSVGQMSKDKIVIVLLGLFVLGGLITICIPSRKKWYSWERKESWRKNLNIF